MRPQIFLTLAALVAILAQHAAAQDPPPSPLGSEPLPLPRTANAPVTGATPPAQSTFAAPLGATGNLSVPDPNSTPQAPGAESWRYVQRDGVWWYYQQNNQWVYLSNGRWVNYVPPGSSSPSDSSGPPAGVPSADVPMTGGTAYYGAPAYAPPVYGGPAYGYPGYYGPAYPYGYYPGPTIGLGFGPYGYRPYGYGYRYRGPAIGIGIY